MKLFSMPIYHRYRFIITTLVLTLFGCGQHDKIEIPEPIQAMTEQRTLSYSPMTTNYMANHLFEINRRFEREFESLKFDFFSVSTESSFDNILDHYSNYFNQFEHWHKIDESELEWDIYSIAHGWRSKDDIFILLSHTRNDYFHVLKENLDREKPFIPYFSVRTLTSL